MMAFLQEGFAKQAGMQNKVRVNARQIIKIRLDLTGYRVKGFVRVREGVDEGLHAGTNQFFEGVLQRIFLRAGQHTMLQDMGQARGIRGRRPEADGVKVLPVHGVQMQHFGAGFAVLHFIGGQAHRFDDFDAQHDKPLDDIAAVQTRLQYMDGCHGTLLEKNFYRGQS
ncbi:MAG: hypothetical protein BWX45_00516 [Deltaproteobacteria bacterium ADurb.Bin002]|nr:MAG: hypothetical protein BWX45_00516 [Deltaproteobacteria bacterium ADurb.Bin002]